MIKMLYPKLREKIVSDRRLVAFTYWAWMFPTLLVFCTIYLLSRPFFFRVSTHTLQGLIISSVFSLLCAGLLYERSIFIFDSTSKRIHWKKRYWWRTTSGIIKFGDVTSVTLEVSRLKTPSYRIVLGSEELLLPLTKCFFPNFDSMEKLRLTIWNIV